MDKKFLTTIFQAMQTGQMQADEAIAQIWHAHNLAKLSQYKDLGFAKVDLDRQQRNGFPEVIFGESKTVDQIVAITLELLTTGANILTTRVDQVKADAIMAQLPDYHFDAASGILSICQKTPGYLGKVAILTAGTADYKVAEEAAVVAAFLGLEVNKFYDVGVAGIHRLLDNINAINQNEVIICVAGMEGALVSVVSGLTSKPVLAVPSGIGYGAGAGGITTLLSMLNSCASGVATFNIGNGFGSAYMAATICRQIRQAKDNKI